MIYYMETRVLCNVKEKQAENVKVNKQKREKAFIPTPEPKVAAASTSRIKKGMSIIFLGPSQLQEFVILQFIFPKIYWQVKWTGYFPAKSCPFAAGNTANQLIVGAKKSGKANSSAAISKVITNILFIESWAWINTKNYVID